MMYERLPKRHTNRGLCGTPRVRGEAAGLSSGTRAAACV